MTIKKQIIKVKVQKIPESKKNITTVNIKKPDKEINIEIPDIVHTPIAKRLGKLINHKTRVRLAKFLVRPVTWLYTEILEEL